MWTSFLGQVLPGSFIIELRLRKYSLRHCQLPEEATLNVFRHHWDCSYPKALLFSSCRPKVYVCMQVCVCVFMCDCVHEFIKVSGPWSTICLHGVWWSRSWLWGTPLSPTMCDKLLIETPVYCLALSTISPGTAAWMDRVLLAYRLLISTLYKSPH